MVVPSATSTQKSLGTILLMSLITTEICLSSLGSPEPHIALCPKGDGVKDGYIKLGTEATCQCVSDSNNSSPYWEVIGGRVDVVEKKAPGSSTLHVKMQDRDGPSQVYTEVSDKAVHMRLTPVQITCKIPRGNVNPYSEVTIVTDPVTKGVTSQKSHSGEYQYVYSFMPEKSGIYRYTCIARNGLFNEIFKESKGEIVVGGSFDSPATSSPLETGPIVAIVLGAILVITVITVTGVWWFRRKWIEGRHLYDTADVQQSNVHLLRGLQNPAGNPPQVPPPLPHMPSPKLRPQQPKTTTTGGNQTAQAMKRQIPGLFPGYIDLVDVASYGQHEKTDISARDSNISAPFNEYIEPVDPPSHYIEHHTMSSSNYTKPENTQSHHTKPQIMGPWNYTESGNTPSFNTKPVNTLSNDTKFHIEQSSGYIEPADPPLEYLLALGPSAPQYESLQGQRDSRSPNYSQLSGQADPPSLYHRLTNQTTEYEELMIEEQTSSGYIVPEGLPSNYIESNQKGLQGSNSMT